MPPLLAATSARARTRTLRKEPDHEQAYSDGACIVVLNHIIWPEYDIQLAMIEGTQIGAVCGLRFVPSVTVGTSGGAHVPGAAMCERCETIATIKEQSNRIADERDRLQRQLDDLNAAYRLILSEPATRDERVPQREEVSV